MARRRWSLYSSISRAKSACSRYVLLGETGRGGSLDGSLCLSGWFVLWMIGCAQVGREEEVCGFEEEAELKTCVCKR